ncbi:MAG: GNAT family N-acetyltransferase [Actinomycetes bacterium]
MSWTIRTATPADHSPIAAVVNSWWGGREMSGLVQPLFLENFSSTSLVAERNGGELMGFLIGFGSFDDPAVAYVHFVGVAPTARGCGLGRELYDRFTDLVAPMGVRRVRCVTSVVNKASVSFHQSIGFAVTGRKEDPGVDGGLYVQLERAVEPYAGVISAGADWPPHPALTGASIELRSTTRDDAYGLQAALDDEVVWRHLTAQRPRTTAEMADIIDSYRESMYPWTVALRRPVKGIEAGTIVGWTSYLEVSQRDARLEIGATAYTPMAWASVVNPEAKLLLLGHAFDDLGFTRVQFKTDIKNHRSQDAIVRLGAHREGILRRYQRRVDQTVRHTVLYSITAEEWPEVRARLEARIAGIDSD